MLNSVQVLRAIAALMVLVFHLGVFLDETTPGGFAYFAAGSSGVDLFFVISGFIMVMSTPADETPLRFAARRIARIVPLYWVVIAMVCGFAAMTGWAFSESDFSPASVLSSLFFVPRVNLHGFIQPVLTDGWTLNYEMLFYLLFAIALVLPRRLRLAGVIVLISAVWLVARAAGSGAAAKFYAEPILFEFAAGCLVGRAVRTEAVATFARRAPMWPLALLAVALAALAWWTLPRAYTPLAFGAPGALLVFAAACQDLYRKPTPASPLTLLGDASYSFYLLHRLVINSVGVLMVHRLGDGWFVAPLVFAVVIAVAAAVSIVSLKGFERPVNRLARRVLMRAAPVSRPAPS